MREHFHVPANYFLSHSVGCLPKRASGQLTEDYFQRWSSKGGDAWPDWMAILDDFRAGLGDLFGTKAHNICPQTNVSSGLTKIIHSLPVGEAKTILCSEEDFPTIGFVLKQAERVGYQVRFVSGDATALETWTDVWDETIGIVHITHAFSNTSKLAPVAQLCQMARERGAISIVDIAQSAGAVPIDIGSWRPDFAIGTGVKFLCFGPGACYLYASDAMIETSAPLDVGWFSHEQPFEMDIHDFRYAPSAMRFFGGTPSPAPFILANAALALWCDLDLAHVQARIQSHLSALCKTIPDDCLASPRHTNARGATLVIDPKDRAPLRHTVAKHEIHCDERKDGFRFSVHGYTSEEEVAALAELLTVTSVK